MKFAVISIFPQMFKPLTNFGITSRAFKSLKAEIFFYNPRDFVHDKHHKIDDVSFGGGAGMVMKYEPASKAILAAKKSLDLGVKVLYLSPQGSIFNHNKAIKLLKNNSIILLCGRYEGIDERLIQEFVDEEISVGDFIVSGGEIPAMLVIDALIRLYPGVLNNDKSIEADSFYSGLLDYPHYTKPATLPNGKAVPDILLSGNHKKIARWRYKQQLIRTYERRKDLLEHLCLSQQAINTLEKYKKDKITTKWGKNEK